MKVVELDSMVTTRRRRVSVWVRVPAAVSLLVVAFVLLQHPARVLETWADASLLRLLGFHGVALISGTSVYLEPAHHGAFWVDLTPACSSLASVLTLGCLAVMLPRRPGRLGRTVLAWAAATVAVVLGNLVRIDSSIVAGLLYGRSTLVLFHNTLGSVFGFAYTLGGFILMLWLLLPDLGPAKPELHPAGRRPFLPATWGPGQPAEAQVG